MMELKDAVVMAKIEVENGCFMFKLKDILNNRHISINQLLRDTNTDYKVIRRFLYGDLIRIDIYVLARLCDYLNCDITDIFEYECCVTVK